MTGFTPLQELIVYDDFDTGLNGWVNLAPNFQEDKMDYYPSLKWVSDWGPPMLSSATFGYAGTHGSLHGTYSMKIGTRPIAGKASEPPITGSMGHAIKRLTFSKKQLIKCEMWYSYKPEQDRQGIGEEDVRAFGFFFDVQDEEIRSHYGVRYLNAADGVLQQRWQLFSPSGEIDGGWGDMRETAPPGATDDDRRRRSVKLETGIDPQWNGRRYENGSGDGFYDIPDSTQRLCYNETADKINWHYFSVTIDVATREYVELRSVNKVFHLRGIQPFLVPAHPRINNLLNPAVWVESDRDRRAFLYVDSIAISTGERTEV